MCCLQAKKSVQESPSNRSQHDDCDRRTSYRVLRSCDTCSCTVFPSHPWVVVRSLARPSTSQGVYEPTPTHSNSHDHRSTLSYLPHVYGPENQSVWNAAKLSRFLHLRRPEYVSLWNVFSSWMFFYSYFEVANVFFQVLPRFLVIFGLERYCGSIYIYVRIVVFRFLSIFGL